MLPVSSPLHIQALAHSKKVQTDDPFDQILGSIALRGEPDTNLVIVQHHGERFITTETRVGRAIPATQLKAELVTSAGADVVSNYSLGVLLDDWQAERHDQAEKKQAEDYQDRIIKYLQTCDGHTALQQSVISHVMGQTKRKTDAIGLLIDMGLLIAEGAPRTLTLANADAVNLYMLGKAKMKPFIRRDSFRAMSWNETLTLSVLLYNARSNIHLPTCATEPRRS